MTNVHLIAANLWGANLSGSRINNANLYNSYFKKANLSNVDLQGSNLHMTGLNYFYCHFHVVTTPEKVFIGHRGHFDHESFQSISIEELATRLGPYGVDFIRPWFKQNKTEIYRLMDNSRKAGWPEKPTHEEY